MDDPDRRALARRAIGLIDLTDLADDHAADGIDELCERAARHATAAVCVWPEYVERCADRLAASGVRVATVVDFPSGDEPPADVLAATATALADGADDVDLVVPYRSFLRGDRRAAEQMIADVADLVHADARVLKVILETGELPDVAVVAELGRLAVGQGADFLKTSTGKTAVGATPDAAQAMLTVIAEAAAGGRHVGLKPSGGIRTLDDAARYLDLAATTMGPDWATPMTFRFGASGLLDALLAELGHGDGGDGRGERPGY